jgi:AraC-like DNA-binding protein
MTQSELIDIFPPQFSIADRVLLIPPGMSGRLAGLGVKECRIFLLVTAGSITLRIGSEVTHVEGGYFVDMLVWEEVTVVDVSDDARVWCLLPNYLFTNESLHGLKPADAESFKDRHSIPRLALTHHESDILERQLTLLANALADMRHNYRAELCQTYFRSFMLEAGNIMLHKRHAIDESEGVETRQDTILRSFLKLVWRYYKSEHNVEFYAGRLCISAKHLSRVVRSQLGKTPYVVIRDELLQEASSLLKDSKKSVQEIATELHFSEMASFCKFFKKHNGLSPTAYRTLERHR